VQKPFFQASTSFKQKLAEHLLMEEVEVRAPADLKKQACWGSSNVGLPNCTPFIPLCRCLTSVVVKVKRCVLSTLLTRRPTCNLAEVKECTNMPLQEVVDPGVEVPAGGAGEAAAGTEGIKSETAGDKG
jgi:hypothetical protein